MRWHEFETHLEHRLCWVHRIPTHRGGGKQRQCPACRRKWSFERLEQQALLVRHFCALTSRERVPSASEVARRTRIAYNTVHKHFSGFHRRLDAFLPDYVQSHLEGLVPVSPDDFIYLRRIAAARGTVKHSGVLCVYILRKLPFEERCELVYRVCILPVLAPRIGLDVPGSFDPGSKILTSSGPLSGIASKLRRSPPAERAIKPLLAEIRRWLRTKG